MMVIPVLKSFVDIICFVAPSASVLYTFGAALMVTYLIQTSLSPKQIAGQKRGELGIIILRTGSLDKPNPHTGRQDFYAIGYYYTN